MPDSIAWNEGPYEGLQAKAASVMSAPGPVPRVPVSIAPRRPRRLLSIAHSYVVSLNRRLAREMSRLGRDRWEITAVAPEFFRGELRDLTLEIEAGEGCRVEPVHARFTRPVQMMLYGERLRELLKGEPWDLVHCWEEPFVLAAGQVARWTPRKVPLVYWTAQNLSKSYPPPFNWVERYCLDRCSGWMGCGESIVRTMLGRGYDRRPHRVMPLGVDLDDFRPDPAAGRRIRDQLGLADAGPPIVGYLGRFVPEKGLATLMGALDSTTSPWRALFVGGGAMEGALRKWGRSHPGRVVVASAVKHADVPAYINAMDLLVAPSQTVRHWREQFGRMLIESFACGVPVVASDSGEIPFVVADAGVIVGEKDRVGWSSAIASLLESPDRRAELARRGLERVREVYSWPIIARRHLEFFDEILGTSPASLR